ncbi:Protein NorD [Rhodospirillaceae bacterium LM-1]|nr:Protein NorD [Rhodospirillaceae bacterium LM-1]
MSLHDLIDPEEFVGRHWHRLVGNAASYAHYPDEAVLLNGIRPMLAVFFRALGGSRGIQLAGSGDSNSAHRLTFRQRLGMQAERLSRPTLDTQLLTLPASIDLFPDRALNRDLYIWLAAYFAHAAPHSALENENPLVSDLAFLRQARATTKRALDALPGLKPLHARLCEAALAARPVRRLPRMEAAVEAVVIGLLGGNPPDKAKARECWAIVEGGQTFTLPSPSSYRSFLPVPLWGEIVNTVPILRLDNDEIEQGAKEEEEESKKRKAKRERYDQADRKDPLALNPFEKILSLAMMINVSRPIDDDDEEEARKAAEEIDEITVTTHERKAASKLKLDLDLGIDAVDPTPIRAKLTYPEWDWRRQSYLQDYCAVLQGMAKEEGELWKPDAAASQRIRQVRRQFEALRPKREVFRRQPDGNDIDMDAMVRFRCDKAAGGTENANVYLDARNAARDMAVMFLVDVSLSTDSWVENRRVLDVEKEALTILTHGLEACGDSHAIMTFTSRKRDHVRIETVKGFQEPLSELVLKRIAALKPGYYTRIGAAIRHATDILNQQPHRHRLLVVLTDGKPNDADHYEGRYGVEDTRRAVQESRRAGAAVFGITVDRKAQDYFPHIFGRGSYHIVGHIGRLPAALPKIYRQLVG